MRELILVSILIFSLNLPVFAKDKAKDYIPNVFVYQIPDEVEESEDEIGKNELNTNTIVKTPVLKTEIQYFDNLDVVSFDKSDNARQINLSKPQKITSSKSPIKNANNTNLKHPYAPVKSKYAGVEESWISDYNKGYEERFGDFLIGSNYSSSLTNLSALEYSSGLFTKYQKNNFALKTQYTKEQTATSGFTVDTFSFAPEYRINKSLALRNVFTTNLTTNRKSAELILLLTPFAYKNNDRLNLEVSAGQTYDENNTILKSKFKFNTSFKL